MAVGEAHGSRGWNPECSQRSPTEPPGVAQPSAAVLQQSMAQLYDGKLSLPGEAHHTPQGVREDLMKDSESAQRAPWCATSSWGWYRQLEILLTALPLPILFHFWLFETLMP